MRNLILLSVFFYIQLMFSQNVVKKCLSCQYEFKAFYYVRIIYKDSSGLYYMNGLTEKAKIILSNDSKLFFDSFYDTTNYTPRFPSFYDDVAKYCGDIFYTMLDDTKSYYTKELFFNKQISDKTIVKNFVLKNNINVEIKISKIKGVFFILDKNDENLDFTMSNELDIYQMDNIQKIYVPYDIVVEDVSDIHFEIE
ncbi:hypothetical protein [Paenimyroides ceti]